MSSKYQHREWYFNKNGTRAQTKPPKNARIPSHDTNAATREHIEIVKLPHLRVLFAKQKHLARFFSICNNVNSFLIRSNLYTYSSALLTNITRSVVEFNKKCISNAIMPHLSVSVRTYKSALVFVEFESLWKILFLYSRLECIQQCCIGTRASQIIFWNTYKDHSFILVVITFSTQRDNKFGLFNIRKWILSIVCTIDAYFGKFRRPISVTARLHARENNVGI